MKMELVILNLGFDGLVRSCAQCQAPNHWRIEMTPECRESPHCGRGRRSDTDFNSIGDGLCQCPRGAIGELHDRRLDVSTSEYSGAAADPDAHHRARNRIRPQPPGLAVQRVKPKANNPAVSDAGWRIMRVM